jgi:hypothetical protein
MTTFSQDRKKTFTEYRRSIKAKMNATKGNLILLQQSKLLNKEEKEVVQEIIDAYTKFNETYNKWRDKKFAKGLKA